MERNISQRKVLGISFSKGWRSFLALVALWFVVVSISSFANWVEYRETILSLAITNARDNYYKELAYRRWVTMQGGIYVRPSKNTPPNPYLASIPNRDVTTTNGIKLTLINPSYMTRQVLELEKAEHGVWGHITSLNPIRPNNAPDSWERKALQQFAAGRQEVTSQEMIDGKSYMRCMWPIQTETQCLKCHASQGYKERDLRGGFSFAVPLEPYLTIATKHRRLLVLAHLLIGGTGLLALFFWRKRQDNYETTLRGQERVHRIVADNTYDWEFWWGPTQELLYVSPSCLRITGYSREEFLASPSLFEEIVHPDDRQIFSAHSCEEHPSSPREIFFRIRRKDGREVWICHVCLSVFDENGCFLGIRGSNRDVTDEKRHENCLLTRVAVRDLALTEGIETFLTKALDHAERLTGSSIGFFHLLDPDQQTLHLMTWSTNTLTTMCSAEGRGSHYPVELAGVWADCIRERRPVIHNDYQSLTHRKGLPPGHAPIVRELVMPIIRDNEVVAIIGVGNKTTHYDEQDLSMLNDISGSIWAKVQQKRDTEEKKQLEGMLQQAQKMESIGTLAGGIAHDFNNILTAIIGFAELVKDEIPAPSPARADIEQVLKASERAKGLVQQILTFSRKADQERKPLMIHLVVKEVLKLLKVSIPSTIKITENIDKECGCVWADPTQIHQVVMNLGTNAYQAMRETGGTLSVSLRVAEISPDDPKVNGLQLLPGRFIKLEVSDTGHGMDQKTRERIFEPYFSTKAKGEGTGLGLAVVHGIVKECGGHVSVYSEPGQGSTFSVYLPLIETQASEGELDTSIHAVLSGSERLLILDDEGVIVEVEKSMLEGLGYQVTTFTDPKMALSAFEEHPGDFDLVLTDMTMPVMTGVEVAGRLKEIRPEVPIILTTGFSELITREKAMAMGINIYLTKPLHKIDLARAIREALADGKANPTTKQDTVTAAK